WPDRWYHTSGDHVDKTDPTQLKRVAVITAAAAYTIASADDEMAEMAVFALSEIKADIGSDVLLDVMKNAKSGRARRAVLMALSDEEGGASVKVLAEILRTETDRELKEQAIFSLGQTKSDDAVAILLEIAKGKDARLAHAAVSALGEIGTPKAKAALLEILEKKGETPGE
ncbi:MAG: HEAT repeat domain-containing protein, partial [Longimicrobiales bacterium]|nr:HEAT repeat domain-containing protein [Longimicrobiales bacterium]